MNRLYGDEIDFWLSDVSLRDRIADLPVAAKANWGRQEERFLGNQIWTSE